MDIEYRGALMHGHIAFFIVFMLGLFVVRLEAMVSGYFHIQIGHNPVLWMKLLKQNSLVSTSIILCQCFLCALENAISVD